MEFYYKQKKRLEHCFFNSDIAPILTFKVKELIQKESAAWPMKAKGNGAELNQASVGLMKPKRVRALIQRSGLHCTESAS